MARVEIRVPDWLDRICTWPLMRYRRLKYGFSFRRMYLGEGEFTIVESPDYYAYSKFKWILLGTGFNLYAVREIKIGPKRTKRVYLHREIMDQPEGLLVDHENNISLDNRRANLRLATHSQNSCNSRRDKSKTSSPFRGVIIEKRTGLYLARIKHNGRQIGLGRFKNEIDAAKTYDLAAVKYHGEFAHLNFPERSERPREVASLVLQQGTHNFETAFRSNLKILDSSPFAVENCKSKIENGTLKKRSCRTFVCFIVFALLALFSCTSADKSAARRVGFTPPEFLRSYDMATAKMTLKDAQAQNVWEFFRQVSAIPRCSKNEGRILNWLKDFAKSRNLACRSDAVGNLVIELPPTKGYENSPAACGEQSRTIVLQSHVDMVCEKTPESKHDFSRDPIELIERDGWVCADGTTLGADNGLGVSLALALADEKIPHPRLELLFTVDEETGLTGANGLEQGFIKGKYLINLDGEDESLIVGCAGGEQTEITMKLEWQNAPEGLECFTLKVSGLYGGHSGVDIDKKRANAIKLLAKTLLTLQDKFDLRMCRIDAGKAANAIPRDAQAVILLAPSQVESIKQQITMLESSFKKEFSATDPNLKVELNKATEFPKRARRFAPCLATEHTEDTERKIINNKLTRSVIPECCSLGQEQGTKIINLLIDLPTGVYRMSDEFAGTVETSNNLARVETVRESNILRITTMQRGFKDSAMDELTGKIADIAKIAGAEVKTYGRYPGWEPDTNTILFKKCTEAYVKLHGKMPPTKVVHAGLEPAVIKQKFTAMEAISVGPTIQNPHSPQERLNIASVDAAWEFLLELIPVLR